jgi:hypothetical protein
VVIDDLPVAQGMVSTWTPQVLQSTRRGLYSRYTSRPQSGTTPERNEVEPPLGLVVVRRTWLVAAAAPSPAVLSGHDPRLEVGRRPLAQHEPDVVVHEVLEPVHVIEYGLELELHRV